MHTACVALSPGPSEGLGTKLTAYVAWCILRLSNKSACTSFCTVHSVHRFVSRPSDATICCLQYCLIVQPSNKCQQAQGYNLHADAANA